MPKSKLSLAFTSGSFKYLETLQYTMAIVYKIITLEISPIFDSHKNNCYWIQAVDLGILTIQMLIYSTLPHILEPNAKKKKAI